VIRTLDKIFVKVKKMARIAATRSVVKHKKVARTDLRPTEKGIKTLGNWTKEDIDACLMKNSKKCLSQTLFEAAQKLFFPKTLEAFSSTEFGDDCGRDDRIGHKRVLVRVGTIAAFDEEFYLLNDLSCGSQDCESLLLNFYKKIFAKDEHFYIEKYLKDKELIHLLIFNQFLLTTRTHSLPQDRSELIGALSWRQLENMGYIVYVAIPDEYLHNIFITIMHQEKITKGKLNSSEACTTLDHS